MSRIRQQRLIALKGIVVLGLVMAVFCPSTRAQTAQSENETASMMVVVKEYDTGAPIGQAHITLEFFIPHGPTIPRKGKMVSYNAKTDAQGRCKFTEINKGQIDLMVTAPEHQGWGEKLKLEKENQVFEVRLKRPQPLI